MAMNEIEVTSASSNLPIQLKYILRYTKKIIVDGSSFFFRLHLQLFGSCPNSYVLQEDVIDFCNMTTRQWWPISRSKYYFLMIYILTLFN